MLHDRLGERNSPPRIEVFVRSLAPDTARPQQDDLIQRLQALASENEIESIDFYVTGDCVCESTAAAETDTGQFLLDRFQQFEAWASESGVDLVGFRERCVDSALSMTTVTGHQFPRITIAVFVDDELSLVTPYTEDNTHHSAAELVETLESSAPSGASQKTTT